ncbi:hypothetical protein [Micrococcus terreus]|uniref:hypothetical protein n=1 Tax=Micrococcus terreus TaxID=574650 RepID=UPI0030188080
MPQQNGPTRPGPGDPQDSRDHRYARAAGKAARAFLDSSRQDAERRAELKRQTERDAEAEREAERQRELARRQAEQEAAQNGPASTLLRTARWWWVAVTLLFTVLATVFVLSGLQIQAGSGPIAVPGVDDTPGTEGPLSGSPGQFVLAIAAGVVALGSAAGTVQLLRKRRSAVGMLTGVGVIVAVPLIIRSAPLLIVVGALLLVGVVMLWLPPVRRQLR